MPTVEYATKLYPKFGVSKYHEDGIYGQGIRIYVIDTGLTNTEENLENVVTRTMKNAQAPKHTHGSFVASIVASKTGGIAPKAHVFLADVNEPNGKIYTSSLVRAIKDAIDLKVDIISISLGTDVYNQDLENVVKRASAEGILVFAASGNCSCRAYEFPSACDAAISVASMDMNRVPSPFNTRNDAVALFAPGQDVLVPGSSKRLSGTSFAVPFASALAALELEKRRREDPKCILSKEDTIMILRTKLGLTADHTYVSGSCVGSACRGGPFLASQTDGISIFLVFAITSGALMMYSLGRLHNQANSIRIK